MEFLQDTHHYLNDYGIIIPSVTQLISWKFGSGYDDVPKHILQAKAQYGTEIHALIEEYEKKGSYRAITPYQIASMEAYKDLAKSLPKVVGNEQMVCFKNRLAGTIDILYEDKSLGDIKTYATLDEHQLLKVKWQLSLYYFCKYGNDNSKYKKKKCHLVYLPKSMQYKHIEIDIFGYKECLELLEEYENAHKKDIPVF